MVNTMSNNRTQNSIRNIAFGGFNRIVSIFFPFIIRTIFIYTLGEEYLGLTSLYSSILQVLNLADLGFANAIVASMYKPIVEHDTETISALLNLYRVLYKGIGLIILFMGLIIMPFLDKLIGGAPLNGVNIYVLWLFYLANTTVSYFFYAYKISLINAHQRNDITELIGAICRTVFSMLQIMVLVVLKNIYLYVLLAVFNSIIYNICCAIECNKRFPQYRCAGKLNLEIKRNISKNIGALALQKIGNTVSVSLDSIVISTFLGLATVAVYGNYFYVISAIAAFVSLIYGAITSSIGNSIVTESSQKNLNDLQKFSYLNIWLVGWCSVCFICLFQDFMVVWMGEKLLFPNWVVICLVLRFYFEHIRKVVLTYKDAAGMWWADKWKPLVGCLVNLILNIIFVKSIGVAGVMMSTIISYILIEMPWETHVLFRIYFKQSEKNYYFEMIYATVSMAISGGITYGICSFFRINHILAIILKLLICLVFPNVVFFVLNRKNKTFINGLDFMKSIIERKYVNS